MLEELAKRDKDWRKMAYHICKDKSLADDLVQDMYVKFSRYDKQVNDFYVYFALKSLFLDTFKGKIQTVELLDNHNHINDGYDYQLDEIKELVLKKVDTLPFFERETLKLTTQQISQRQLSRETDISLRTIKETVKKTKQLLWEDLKRLKE